jgi:adenine-specific DNA-methyltransferase
MGKSAPGGFFVSSNEDTSSMTQVQRVAQWSTMLASGTGVVRLTRASRLRPWWELGRADETGRCAIRDRPRVSNYCSIANVPGRPSHVSSPSLSKIRVRRPWACQLSIIDLSELLLTTEALDISGVTHGEIFTRRWIVELILDLVGYTPDKDLADFVALEPACGSGAFLMPMVERLSESVRLHGRMITDARHAIVAHDLLTANVEASQRAVRDILIADGWARRTASDLASVWVTQADFLLAERDAHTADFVVGNPPYIRLEEIPEARSNAYRAACPTMGGRADIFVGFYEIGLRALRDGGRLGFICADRWMRNAYGKDLRQLVTRDFAVDGVIVMHDVDAFEEQVSAYPAITVLRAGPQGPALMADTSSAFDECTSKSLREWLASGEQTALHCDGLTAAWLPNWFTTQAGWPTGSPDRLALVADLEARFPLLEDAGCKVGIGLASGADQVYVTKNADAAEPERMLPMVMRSDLRDGVVRYSGNYLVNPWSPDGLVDLEEWPRLRGYLEQHWTVLAGRNVGQRNPGREHRTIDRVIEGLAAKQKLLLADMSDRIWPVLDRGEFYPHHNLYWITSDEWDLEVLGGLLLSEVAELFISTYCVRMRGGTLRFQAQYLRRIRLPRYSDIGEDDRSRLRAAFDARDVAGATAVALQVYGVESLPA